MKEYKEIEAKFWCESTRENGWTEESIRVFFSRLLRVYSFPDVKMLF